MNYYVLFTCDEWKSHTSMSLAGVFTKAKLIATIKAHSDKFEIDGALNKSMDIRELNNAVTYGYIEELSINEVLL